MLLINPFLCGLIGCHCPGLLSVELVNNLALVHPTALVGVQLGLAFPVIYPEGGGPEPLGLISSVLGEAEAQGSHSACVLDMPDQHLPPILQDLASPGKCFSPLILLTHLLDASPAPAPPTLALP